MQLKEKGKRKVSTSVCLDHRPWCVCACVCVFPSHRRLHNEERGHGCEYCGKHFQDSMRLRMHMLSHTGT